MLTWTHLPHWGHLFVFVHVSGLQSSRKENKYWCSSFSLVHSPHIFFKGLPNFGLGSGGSERGKQGREGGRVGSLYLCGCIDFSGSVSGVSISMTEVNKWLLPWATERQDRKSCLIFSFKQRPNIASLRCCQAYLIHTHCSIHTHPHVYLAGNGEGSRLLWLW